MDQDKRDLVIHFNEQRRIIKIYPVNAEVTAKVREAEFGLELPLSQLKDFEATEAEQRVGKTILMLLDMHAAAKIDIRDYGALREEANSAVSERLIEIAQSDPSAMFQIAVGLFANALEENNWDKVLEAEQWLVRAVDASEPDAVEYFKTHWPREKARAERQILGS